MPTSDETKAAQFELFDASSDNQPSTPWRPTDGRDELNLAEFPLAALSNRIVPGQKTLVFRDAIYDSQAKQRVERQLTIMAADKFGLPNSVDDEIILALIQLSKRQGFTSKTVPFSRYEIIQVLGWEDESWNYRRIVQALDRWTSVTLKYENAWWEPTSKAWVDETFHIIERLTEVKDERGKERAAFVWSDVIFQNLQSGNLKPLDLDLYRRLTSPTAKRLYRLLDKRFYRHRRVEFDLVDLAYHKLGISQNYLIANIKQRLQPAIKELEDVGYFKPADKEKRYRKHGVGKWHIIFEQASDSTAESAGTLLTGDEQLQLSEIEVLLVEFGVTSHKARRLVITQPEGYLREKIDVVRFLRERGDPELKNPAGYLVKSIEEKYALPTDYKTPEQRLADQEKASELIARKRQSQQAKLEEEQGKREGETQAVRERTERVAAYLSALTPKQFEEVKCESMARKIAAGHREWVNHVGRIGELYRQTALEEFVLDLIEKQGASPSIKS